MSANLRTTIDLDYIEPQKFKDKPNDDELRFGHDFTDRMLLREYRKGTWLKGKILPYQNFSLPPSTLVFHYGQEIFEGLKAFRQFNNKIIIFRPDENAKRFNASAERMVMPTLEDGYFLESTRKLVEIEKTGYPENVAHRSTYGPR